MSKLTELSDRIKSTKEKLEAEADKLHAKLDEIDKAAPTAFDHGHRFIAAQKAEVEGITATLTQLTNLPLDGSENVSPDVPPNSQYARG